ncbi:MAG TPA: DUF4062 domain-containing protein [Syntrophobacteria bacterium]|nr:DUF4062 domain-containing protein [Syntrophobacteria bacterium]
MTATPVSKAWRSRSLFVSSTFEDMHAERDHLQNWVFPELAEWLRARHMHLEPIDLRWGVETSSLSEVQAKEATVLKVCLAEIDRSRPFLVVLLGDRYGWIPPPERVREVAAEVGLVLEPAPRSVTALEIEYGALRAAEAARPLFYIRDPLPYAEMGLEAAARYRDEPAADERVGLLEALKATLHARFPERVRRYALRWDATSGRPAGLEEFGELVLRDLKAELESESAGWAATAPSDWREEEDLALDAFVEDCERQAHGRDALVESLVAELTGASAAGTRSPLTAVVGGTGTGKSVLFAAAARRLQNSEGVLLLAHSAGVSLRSQSVDLLLRRWCARLSSVTGEADRSDELLDSDQLKTFFHQLLTKASARQRVVLLVDALDQFERTPAALHLTWLPPAAEWPANVLLAATAIPGTESGSLEARGAKVVELPPVLRDEARGIATNICGRWHKKLPEAVLTALIDKRLPGGERASENPLWLTVAVNELLVLDADDFALRAGFTGSAEERLVHLLVRVVESLPPTAGAAYGYVFERIEATYGRPFVGAALTLLALSRFGLRESDLEAVLAGELAWSSASFAAVRRALRAHLAARGKAGAWTFTHREGQRAAVERYAGDPAVATARHRRIAAHLGNLPKEDPLRRETMYHLIEADDRPAAVEYFRRATEGEELSAAFDTLREALVGSDSDRALSFAVSLLGDPDQAPETDEGRAFAYLSGQRLLEFTEKSRLLSAAPPIAVRLLGEVAKIMRQRRAHDPMTEEVLYRTLQILGRLHVDAGDYEAAAAALESAAEINDRHAEGRRRELERSRDADPEALKVKTIFFHQTERDRMLGLQLLGAVHRARRDAEKARAAYERALEIAEFFSRTYPKSELAATDLSSARYFVGDCRWEEGDHPGALAAYEAGLREALRDLTPKPSALVVRLRSNGHVAIGRVHARGMNLRTALQHYAQGVKLARELAHADPGDEEAAWRFLRANDEAADFLGLVHLPEAAAGSYESALETCVALVNAGRVSADLFAHIRHCFAQQAIVFEAMGDARAARISAERAAKLGFGRARDGGT